MDTNNGSQPGGTHGCDGYILIVDDEPDTRAIIRHTLEPLGLEIREAADGEYAREACTAALPALVVTDVMMPRMGGVELTAWIRSSFPDCFVPVLMLTALREVEDRIGGLQSGADEYLTKPFHHRELRARADSLLRVKVLTDRLRRLSAELEHLNVELSRVQSELIRRERQLVAVQLAGACAHNLGQPVTSILLNCMMLERSIAAEASPNLAQANQAVNAIKEECEAVQTILEKMVEVDANETEHYVGEMRILELGSGIGRAGLSEQK